MATRRPNPDEERRGMDPSMTGGQMGGEKMGAGQLQLYLKGIDFPAGKQKIIQAAKSNNAPDSVISFLNRLPEKQYQAPTDVESEFGKMR